MARSIRLGTRGSLLAVAQSRLVASALRARRPDLHVEIEAVETRGDRDTGTPLDRVTDPDFFSAELDRALLDGRFDFTVHSMKDLGNARPDGICRAAVPERENPRDVVLFRSDIVDRLRAGAAIRIGSSSERRRLNAGSFLRDCLPHLGRAPNLSFRPLRGAVDRRVARIAGDAADPDGLDGVILALAGLARLWRDPHGRRSIEPHLAQARWMILPLSECPTAPAQGALAVECRADDRFMRDVLAVLHDPATVELVQRELDTLRTLPAPVQQQVGVTAIEHSVLGPLLYRRGAEAKSYPLAWNGPEKPDRPEEAVAWDGGYLLERRVRRAVPHDLTLPERAAVFVAHWHATSEALRRHPDARIWTSGAKSWRELAARGLWVEGCADNLGFDELTATLACEVLQLPELGRWTALTRRGAEAGWRGSGIRQVVGTYEAGATKPADLGALRETLDRTTDFFWGSIDQYRAIEAYLPAAARHACGAGKTARALRKAGVESPLVFPSRREWRAWLR